VLQILHHSISRDRLTRYLIATNGNLGRAIKLYEINIQISQTLYGVLHGYEITLRNAMHNRLVGYFGREDWYRRAKLNPTHEGMVRDAEATALRGHANRYSGSVPIGKVVAELGLGFWTGMAAGGYEQSLWQPCLRQAFPNTKLSRKAAHSLLSDIKQVRNRVAHHERVLGSNGVLYAGLHPIHRTELTLRPDRILDCVAWICPVTSDWIRATAQFENCMELLDSIKSVRF
jgi:hypothetical protein